jgi:hypothetical protein
MRATDISIASPCGADWRTMKPSDTKRFCETCQKHVHDLSAMTAAGARALLAEPRTEGLCVRYLADAYGEVVFRSPPLAPSLLVRARRVAARAVAVALPMTLAACSSSLGEPPQPFTMGAVACPMPEPDPSVQLPVHAMGEMPALPVPAPSTDAGATPSAPPAK